MKKLTAMVLTLALLLAPASMAADPAALFPAVRDAVSFPDVPAGTWYESAATLCYETGLLNGTDNGFAPTAIVTVAEAAALAARIGAVLDGEGSPYAPSGADEPWYAGDIRYLKAIGVTITALDTPAQPATRRDFFALLAAVIPDTLLAPINSITTLPDTNDATALTFYNAGILTGVDQYGTFAGRNILIRAEMATMAARIVRPALRITFTPTPMPTDAVFFTLNGRPVTRAEFLLLLEEEFAAVGSVLDWNQAYTVGDLNTYFRERVIHMQKVKEAVFQFAEANMLPADDFDQAYTAGVELLYNMPLRAKHILLRTVDDSYQPLSAEEQAAALQQAEIFLEVLQATPTEAQFDELMAEFSEDPGSAYYPEGYVFGIGEMVSEFESAVLSLPLGGMSGIVESDFGYHIILRLDPEEVPDALDAHLQSYAETVYNAFSTILLNMMDTYTCTTTEAFDRFDCESHYAVWLAS